MENTQRIKNILDGKITDSTKIISGYKKKQEEYVEGDIWEDSDGKQWTIKNGLKQNITKLDEVRHLINMPINCPICNRLMKTRLDKKFWGLKGRCFNCIVEDDTNMIINGTFIEHSREVMKQNAYSFIEDLKAQVKEYIKGLDSKHFVTETGDVEEWIGGLDKTELQNILDKKLDTLQEKTKEAFDKQE